MAKYKIIRPIEHNRKLYVPATAPSAADGTEIEVDASGLIELSDQEASQLTQGQVQPFPETPAPREDPGKSSSKKSSFKTQPTAATGDDRG
jgi:hypothetical protein